MSSPSPAPPTTTTTTTTISTPTPTPSLPSVVSGGGTGPSPVPVPGTPSASASASSSSSTASRLWRLRAEASLALATLGAQTLCVLVKLTLFSPPAGHHHHHNNSSSSLPLPTWAPFLTPTLLYLLVAPLLPYLLSPSSSTTTNSGTTSSGGGAAGGAGGRCQEGCASLVHHSLYGALPCALLFLVTGGAPLFACCALFPLVVLARQLYPLWRAPRAHPALHPLFTLAAALLLLLLATGPHPPPLTHPPSPHTPPPLQHHLASTLSVRGWLWGVQALLLAAWLLLLAHNVPFQPLFGVEEGEEVGLAAAAGAYQALGQGSELELREVGLAHSQGAPQELQQQQQEEDVEPLVYAGPVRLPRAHLQANPFFRWAMVGTVGMPLALATLLALLHSWGAPVGPIAFCTPVLGAIVASFCWINHWASLSRKEFQLRYLQPCDPRRRPSWH